MRSPFPLASPTTKAAMASAAVLTLTWSCASAPDSPSGDVPPPPETRTVDVVETLHGVEVPDPYRWLEDQDDPEVQSWAKAQQQRTEAILSGVDGRSAIRDRLTELWSFERRSTPTLRGGVWLWSRQLPDQDQPVWFVGTTAYGDDARALFDPNAMEDTSVGDAVLSPDGRHVALALSEAGSDWRTWRIVRTTDGSLLEDSVPWSKFSTAAWAKDGSGFFYQRYPQPADGEVLEARTENAQLCFHTLGGDAADDRIVYERPDQPTWGFAPTVSDDGTLLVVEVWSGTDRRNRVALVDLTDPGLEVRPFLWRFDAAWEYLGRLGDGALVFRTDLDAPRGRVVAIPSDAPQPPAPADESGTEDTPDQGGDGQDAAGPGAPGDETAAEEEEEQDTWQPRPLVAEGPDRIDAAEYESGHLALTVLRDASHRLLLVDLRSPEPTVDPSLAPAPPTREVPLPGLGTAGSLTTSSGDQRLWLTYESFLSPPAVLSVPLDHERAATDLAFAPEVPLRTARLTVRQPSFENDDGTRLLAFLVHGDGLPLDRGNPTWLYGYGGFDISLTPRYQPDRIVWAERGGLYMQVTLRGGGEFGESWHEDGMLDRKQNVFDDLYAAAAYLDRNDYAAPGRVGVNGRSNGGLLAAAAVTQRPELFGAAVPEVGVLDMLRYHQFTIGAAWIPEYGDPRDAAAFEWLRAYSPVHNVRPGLPYPPVMVMTSDHDDRVVPAHSFKFAATMQATSPSPTLLRVTESAGHGAGKPRSVEIDEATDRLAFLEWCLKD